MSKLLILGAGQYGMVAKEIAESMQLYDQIAFLDDNNSVAVGKLRDYERFNPEYDCTVVALGNAELRLELLNKLEKCGFEVPILIHERAYVSQSAVIGKGTFIEPMVAVHTEVTVGNGCIISAGTILNHNCLIGDGCHLNCGSIVKARAVVEKITTSDCGQIIE